LLLDRGLLSPGPPFTLTIERDEMKKSNDVYDNLSMQLKENAGFPFSYCYLSPEQELFVTTLLEYDLQSPEQSDRIENVELAIKDLQEVTDCLGDVIKSLKE